jgi:hypothetical protein
MSNTEHDEDGTEEITVTCTWRSHHVITVPRGFQIPSTLSGFPPEALEEMTSHTAELVDWE